MILAHKTVAQLDVVNVSRLAVILEVEELYPIFYSHDIVVDSDFVGSKVKIRMQGALAGYLNPEKYGLPPIWQFDYNRESNYYNYESPKVRIVLSVDQEER